VPVAAALLLAGPCRAQETSTRGLERLREACRVAEIDPTAGDSIQESAFRSDLEAAREGLRLVRDAAADSTAEGLARASFFLYGRAMLHRAIVLHRAAVATTKSAPMAETPSFAAVWNEAANGMLAVLRSRPALRRGETSKALLALCDPEMFAGETFALPERDLIVRMATLPESLAHCCLDEAACAREGGADCAGLAIAGLAGEPRLDALVGFRNNRAYWALLAGRPPRDAAADNRVACTALREAGRMLTQFRIQGTIASPGPTSPGEALAALRAAGSLDPPGLNPFETIPGLRNPRWDRDGTLVCDLVLLRPSFERANASAQAWIRSIIPGGATVHFLDSRER